MRHDPANEDRIAMRATRCRMVLLVIGAWMACTVAFAQAAAPIAAPGTGDAWVDAMLVDIDRYAARYPDAFVDEMARYHGAPRDLVETLLADARWSAGEVYFACTLAQYAGQPCRNAVARHDGNNAWSTLEQRFGVAPGSDAFHRIKRAIVLSYGRWARPLQVDASLHAEFPRHELAPEAPRPRAVRGGSATAPPTPKQAARKR
jgi:hypothetical protein